MLEAGKLAFWNEYEFSAPLLFFSEPESVYEDPDTGITYSSLKFS